MTFWGRSCYDALEQMGTLGLGASVGGERASLPGQVVRELPTVHCQLSPPLRSRDVPGMRSGSISHQLTYAIFATAPGEWQLTSLTWIGKVRPREKAYLFL